MLVHELSDAYTARLQARELALNGLFDNHVTRIRLAVIALKSSIMFRFVDIEKEWETLGFDPYDVVHRLRTHLLAQGLRVDTRADHLYVYGWTPT